MINLGRITNTSDDGAKIQEDHDRIKQWSEPNLIKITIKSCFQIKIFICESTLWRYMVKEHYT